MTALATGDHFRNAPNEAALRELLTTAAIQKRPMHSTLLAVEPADWVAQSLSGLVPVRAGRFIVHGATTAPRFG